MTNIFIIYVSIFFLDSALICMKNKSLDYRWTLRSWSPYALPLVTVSL